MAMYLNSKGISFQEIMRQLEARSTQVKQIKQPKEPAFTYLGVMCGKYYGQIDKAMLELLGIRVIRLNNRSLKIDHVIQNQQKYNKYFKGLNLKLLAIKSKDMIQMLNKQYISFCFNYSIIVENFPKTWQEHCKFPIDDIKLALLQRKESKVDPNAWTPSNKGIIAS